MMGTLASVLAGKKIRTFADRFTATVTGDVEDVNGVLKITRIGVHYRLRLAEGQKQGALEAMATYLTKCPAAQSVIGCIRIEHELEMVLAAE